MEEKVVKTGAELGVEVEFRMSWMVLNKFLRVVHLGLVLLVHVHCCSLFGFPLIEVPA